MNNMLKKTFGSVCVASVLVFGSAPAQADDLPIFNTNYPNPSSACATFGNLVSCSTAVLEYLAAQNYPGYTAPYTFSTAQGNLIDTVVLATNNGNILDNGDMVPSGSEDAFSTINANKDYFYTGDGNDPNNNVPLLGDTPFSWDISLSSLINKLTFGGAFHEMLIGFDMNQPQNSIASLPIWSLITVRDVNGNQQNVYFETQNVDPLNPFADPLAYLSDKTFDGSGVTSPGADDFAMTVGSICVVNATVSYPSPDGSTCPSGGTLVNTNRGSNELEFINYLPGLDLQDLFSQGYDTLSVQVWMGCFNTPPRNGPDRSGPDLLDGGAIGPCDNGGFGDIFLLAGDPQSRVPEPGTLVLLAAGLLGLAYRRFRQN